MIGANNENRTWTFFDSGTGALLKHLNEQFLGNILVTSSPGLLIRRRSPGTRNSTYRPNRIELLDAETDELLLVPPELDQSGQARFPYPKALEDMLVSDCAAVWRNGELDILAWPSLSSSLGASEAWLVRINAEGCTVHCIRFAWSDEMDQRVRATGEYAETFRYPRPNVKGLIATDQGLVIIGGGMRGFWFIPKAELDKRRTISAVSKKIEESQSAPKPEQ